MPAAVVEVAACLEARVSLTDPQSDEAICYVKARPFMWDLDSNDYKKSKDEREGCWATLGAKFGYKGEYHFFLFVIVGFNSKMKRVFFLLFAPVMSV